MRARREVGNYGAGGMLPWITSRRTDPQPFTRTIRPPHRPARHGTLPARAALCVRQKSGGRKSQEDNMGRGLLLWLLGIPLPIILTIWLLGGLHS